MNVEANQAGLRSLREAKGLSLSELARVAGVDKATVSMAERGLAVPMLTTNRRLAAAYGIRLGRLYELIAESQVEARADDGAGER